MTTKEVRPVAANTRECFRAVIGRTVKAVLFDEHPLNQGTKTLVFDNGEGLGRGAAMIREFWRTGLSRVLLVGDVVILGLTLTVLSVVADGWSWRFKLSIGFFAVASWNSGLTFVTMALGNSDSRFARWWVEGNGGYGSRR